MKFLDGLSPEDQKYLASLPYKVGVYISHAEDEEGEVDDEREISALEACIRAIANLHDDQPVVAEIFEMTLNMQDHWPQWEAKSFNAPDDARKAIAILTANTPEPSRETALKNFKQSLMEVAKTVAQAYGEFGQFEDDEKQTGIFAGLVGKITQKLSTKNDANNPMNISAGESNAIAELRKALRS